MHDSCSKWASIHYRFEHIIAGVGLIRLVKETRKIGEALPYSLPFKSPGRLLPLTLSLAGH
jgi:hypothetical protein